MVVQEYRMKGVHRGEEQGGREVRPWCCCRPRSTALGSLGQELYTNVLRQKLQSQCLVYSLCFHLYSIGNNLLCLGISDTDNGTAGIVVGCNNASRHGGFAALVP